jgi:hypothetical protein
MNFTNEARQFGRSVEILQAVRALRQCVQELFTEFQANIFQIFPKLRNRPSQSRRLRVEDNSAPVDSTINRFTTVLDGLAMALQGFYDRVAELWEFPDNTIRTIFYEFRNDLKVSKPKGLF